MTNSSSTLTSPIPTKTCSRCEQVLSLDSFYKHPTTKDKKFPYCKECCFKQHKGQYKRWSKLPEVIRQTREYQSKRTQQNRAKSYLYRAIKTGKVKRLNYCQYEGCTCTSETALIEAHHWNGYEFENYLVVVYLCRHHHYMVENDPLLLMNTEVANVL